VAPIAGFADKGVIAKIQRCIDRWVSLEIFASVLNNIFLLSVLLLLVTHSSGVSLFREPYHTTELQTIPASYFDHYGEFPPEKFYLDNVIPLGDVGFDSGVSIL
jgi:hypothetical protein